MSLAILAAGIWAVTAATCRALRPRDAVTLYGLIGCGVPIIGWLVLELGPWVGLLALAIGAALLHWHAGALLGGDKRGGKGPALGPEGSLGASE